MPQILKFPAPPEHLVWLKKMVEDHEGFLRDLDEGKFDPPQEEIDRMRRDATNLRDIYFYFRWSHAYQTTDRDAEEHYVACGLLHKYYNKILHLTAHPAVEEEMAKAEAMLKASNAEIRRRKERGKLIIDTGDE